MHTHTADLGGGKSRKTNFIDGFRACAHDVAGTKNCLGNQPKTVRKKQQKLSELSQKSRWSFKKMKILINQTVKYREIKGMKKHENTHINLLYTTFHMLTRAYLKINAPILEI